RRCRSSRPAAPAGSPPAAPTATARCRGRRRCSSASRCSPGVGVGARESRRPLMSTKFAVGDHVSWNSEAGHVSGTITEVHTQDFEYKGHTRRASEDDPQYEIRSDKTDHVAAHKGSALRKLSN